MSSRKFEEAQEAGWTAIAVMAGVKAALQDALDEAWSNGDIQFGPDTSEVPDDPKCPAALLMTGVVRGDDTNAAFELEIGTKHKFFIQITKAAS